MSKIDLKGKNIIITGASSGIGRECAVQCSKCGANVILLGRDKERLEETMSLLDKSVKSKYYAIDLVKYNDVGEWINQISEEFFPISGLINSAGISTTLPLKLATPEKINDFYNINVTAGINLTKLIAQKGIISDTGGSIVFISSVMGVVGEAGKTIYSLTKGALISGVKSMAVELAIKNIRVNCVSPGVVETPMSKNAVYSKNEESYEKIKKLHPLGLGKTTDVANLIMFLMSDLSGWITGTNLIIDGGYTAK